MLIQTESYYYQDQLSTLFSFKEEKARYRKSYLEWDNIERANQAKLCRVKAKYLSKDAQAVLAPIIQNLKKGSVYSIITSIFLQLPSVKEDKIKILLSN